MDRINGASHQVNRLQTSGNNAQSATAHQTDADSQVGGSKGAGSTLPEARLLEINQRFTVDQALVLPSQQAALLQAMTFQNIGAKEHGAANLHSSDHRLDRSGFTDLGTLIQYQDVKQKNIPR